MKKVFATAGAVSLLGGLLGASGALTASATTGPSGRHVVAAPSPAFAGQALGTPAPSSSLTFMVALQPRDRAGAEAFVQQVSDPGNAHYRAFLTPAQYTTRFAATASDVAQVSSWLRGQGLTPGAAPDSRSYLTVTGSVAAVEKAFATTIRSATAGSRSYTAPATAVSVPDAVASLVSGVVGLDRSQVLTTSAVRPDAHAQGSATPTLASLGVSPASSTGVSDACSSYYGQYRLPYVPKAKAPFNRVLPGAMCGYTAPQMRAARKMTAVAATGKGMKVGITLWCNDPRIFDDTNSWARNTGFQTLRSSQYTVLLPQGGFNKNYCDNKDSGGVNVEQALDVQSIHGAAPDANIVYSAAAAPFDDALIEATHALVDGNKVDAISNSWGGSETNNAAVNGAFSDVFIQAAAQGISVLYSSGDNGDNTAGDQSTTAPTPDYPAANPWITSVGGTSLATANASGSKVAWEQAWNTERSVLAKDHWGTWTYRYGGGGGVSNFHPEPYYQKGVVPTRFTGTDPHRAYPDLAGAGDPYTGYLIGYHDAQSASGNFTLSKIGGTSWSSPWTAGTVVLAGKRVGFLNPKIYGSGHAGLTDIAGNQLTHGFEVKSTFVSATGAPYTALTTVGINSQNLQDQTLTSDRGYDNLTGFGVPTSTAAFLRGIS